MGVTNPIKRHDMNSIRQAIQQLSHLRLGPEATPVHYGLILTGLTGDRLVATNSAKALVSSDLINWVTGTGNQVLIADDGDGTVTFSLPQNIDVNADVVFNSADLVNIYLDPTTVTGTATITDGTAFEGDTTGGDFTINLPTLAGNGRVIFVCCSGSNTITLDPSGSETINGDLTFDLIEDESLILIDFGTEWRNF